MLKMIIVWGLALFFTINSLLLTIRTNFNFGHFLMWTISACFILYGIFHKPIDAFCETGFGRILKYGFGAGIVLFVGLFVFVAVSGYARDAKGNEKAIIVLGAGLRGEEVSGLLHRRLTAALETYEQNPAAVIVVTGGQGPGEAIPEALAMQRWLIARGVPETQIIMEDKSTSTEENLLFSQQLLAQRGINAGQPVAVVTNAFHCYRARQYATAVGFSSVTTVPATMSPSSVFPSYMREIFAILYMWVFKK